MTPTLQQCVQDARRRSVAIGHFNISNLDGFWAVADAAQALDLPVIIGVSEGERDFVGLREIAAVVAAANVGRKQPIFLNADHSYSFERVKEAIDAGFDMAIFDGAKLGLEENIAITKQCVDYARERGQNSKPKSMGVDQTETRQDRSLRPFAGRDQQVEAENEPRALQGERVCREDLLGAFPPTPSPVIEGELGYIGSSSKVLSEIPAGAVVTIEQMTKPDDAARFVRETGVDLLAPAVGNIHGMIKGGNPALNAARTAEIYAAAGVPLVLHGASGSADADVRSVVEAGAAIVHFSTELRVAYRSGLVKSLSEDPDEVAPYKYLKPAKQAMQKVVEEKLRLLSIPIYE